MNKALIPNTFQHPNAYVDWLAYYLTPEEEKVLNKAIREILGWHNKIESRQARIALSVFEHGKVSKETGEQLCLGCGLGRAAIRKALKSLDAFKILVKVGDATNDGQMYRIQDNYQLVDLDGLKARREQQDAKNASRTSKARGVLSDRRGIVAHTPPHVVAHTPGGIVGQTQRNPVETQRETQNHAPSGAVSEIQSDIESFHDGDVPEAEPERKKPVPEKRDVVLDIFQGAVKQKEDPLHFLKPGTPCGDHAYLEPYQIFCGVIQRDPSTVGERKTLTWLRQFEKIADVGGCTVPPGTLAQAIQAIRDDWSFEHKKWTDPFCKGFIATVELTAAQVMVDGQQQGPSALAKAMATSEDPAAWMTKPLTRHVRARKEARIKELINEGEVERARRYAELYGLAIPDMVAAD